ncbi:MAG: hypothetical protein LBQ83_05800 [Candidatus Margulisbacteria bacterium]|jgi:hypothetical protein|nr:hypothetical protein [Candidatus Margulisiibacteriota bacterium]
MPEITQENFRVLLPGKIAKTAEICAQIQNCSPKEALLKIYFSAAYRELEQEQTKLWWSSPLQLYRALV